MRQSSSVLRRLRRPGPIGSALRTCVASLLVSAGACVAGPVEWEDALPVPAATVAPEGDDGLFGEPPRLAFDAGGGMTLQSLPYAALGTPPDSSLCPGSLRTVIRGARVDAAWWSVRPDSSAELRAATSPDSGRSWSTPSTVDPLDRSDVGCARPAPSIAASGGDVHVAYSMRAPEGTGIFFSHSMDEMGMRGFFHSPVIVIYGDRLVSVAVAADGNRVAVAYDDPSGRVARVGLALSRSQGHLFEERVIASTSAAIALDPDVSLAGDTVAVAWTVRGPGLGAEVISNQSRVVRRGIVR